MIKIDFELAVTVFLTIFLFLVITSWMFYNYSKERNSSTDSANLMQCPYCAHVFFDYSGNELRKCPKCHSYIELEQHNTET